MAVTAAELLVLVRAEGVEQTAASLLGLSEATSGAALGLGALAVAAAATVGAIGASIAQAAAFQTTLQNVQNNTTMAATDVGVMRDAVLQLGAATGAPLDQLASGFQHAFNITNDTTTAMNILNVATASAMSTGGNAAQTTNILANAMHEYGADVSHAATEQERQNEVLANATRYMAVFHLAAADGNMSLEEFANNSGKTVSAAANLHVPIEQVAAAFAALTEHGYTAAQANTQLTNILTHLAAPTKAAEKEIVALSKATGVDLVHDFSAAGLASKGLDGVLADLHVAFQKAGYSATEQSGILARLDGSLESTTQKFRDQGMGEAQATEEAMKLINAQRGGLGLAVLLGTGAADYTRILGDLTNQQLLSSVTQDAFNRSQETAGFQWNRFKVLVQEAAIAIGAAFLPAVTRALTAVNEFVVGLMHSGTAQQALTDLATRGGAALDGLVAKLKDSAFQQGLKDFALGALDAGKAAIALGQAVASVLGPPLQAAVTWFNSLDTAGKQSVVTFALVAGSAVKFGDELGSLKNVVEDVIGAFARKEAAKKSLTAANTTLAQSVAKTAASMGLTSAAAGAGALAFADLAVVTGVATAASIGSIVVADQLQKKFGEQNDILAQSAAHWDAASIAIEHGANETNSAIVYFQKWLDVHQQTISSLTQGEALWNQYIADTTAAKLSTEGLTTAALGTAGAMPAFTTQMQAAGFELGNAGNKGAGFNDTLVGLTVGVQALASTLPPIATGLGAAATAMGDVATHSTAMGNGLSAAAINLGAVDAASASTTSSLVGATSAFGGAGLAAGAFGAAIATAQGQVQNYDAALKGLGAEHSHLQGYLTTLQTEWNNVTAAVAKQGSATADQQAKINALAPAIQFLNASLGENTSKVDAATLAAVQQMVATNNTTGAANAAATAFHAQGLATGAMVTGQLVAASAADGVTTSTNAATTAITTATGATTTYTAALTVVPTTVTTAVSAPGATEATGQVNAVTAAVATVPKSFTVTAVVDTSAALAAIANLDAHMPHSPAKTGPFSTLPNWNALFSALPAAFNSAGAAFDAFGATVGPKFANAGRMAVQGLTNGMNAMAGTAADAAAGVAAGAEAAVVDFMELASPSKRMHRHGQNVAQGLANGIQAHAPVVHAAAHHTGTQAGAGMAAGVKASTANAAKAAADLAVSVAKGITDTLAAMHLLSTYDFATGSPSGGQFAMLGTLTAQMVATIQDAAKGFGDAGLKAATAFADAAAKVGTMVKAALTGLQDLANYDFSKGMPTAQQLGMLTTLTVSLVQTIQDAAAQFNDLGLKSATTFAEAAGKVGGMVKNALAGLSELANFDFAKGSPTGAQLGMLTTLVVSLVRSIQDAATSFDTAGLKAATTFSDAAAKVGGMVKNALAGLKELAAFDFAGGTPTADQLGVFAASVAAVVRAIEDAAAGFTGPGLAAATAFSDAASKALGIIKTGVAGLTALATFTAPSAAAIDAFVVAVRELVAKFAVAAASIGTDGVTAATAFGTAANTAVHTIKTGIDAFKAFKDMRVPSAEAIDTLVVAVTYVVGKFRDMADAMGHDALTKAQAFGTAVETTAKSVQTAIGIFKSLTEPPFKGALTKIMTEFNGDFDGALAMMIEAHGKAAQFETEARMYKEAMLNAATSIAAGNAALANAALPGSSLGRDMKAAGQNLGDALHDAVRDTLQIKSPSQVMVTVGRQVVAGLVGGMSSTQQDAVKKAAELAKAVADAVIVTLTSLRALGNLNSAALPSGDQVGGFLASTMQVVDAVAAAASAMNGKALDAAVKFAAGAGKVLGFVGSAVTALTGLAALTPPAASAIYAFDKTLRLLVNDFALTAEQVGTDMLGLATTFSTGAGAVADAVGKGVAGLTKLASYVDPAPAAIYALGKTLRLAIQDFAALAALVGKDMLAEATSLADGAGKVADTVGKGVAGLGKLVDYVAPPAAAVYALGKTIRLLVADFAALADLLGNDASASAGRFADSAGKVVGIIGNAVDGFVKLGTYNGIANTLIGPFVETVRTLITAIGQAAAQFTTEGLTLAGRFADTAAKAVGILSNGVDGFTKLRDYNGVGDAAIDAFVATVTTLLRGIAQASTQFSAKGLDLAGKFADTAGKVVGLLVSGVAGFAELAKFTTPTSAAIGEFIRVLTDITSRFTWYVPTFAKGQLAAAQLFAETAGKVIGIIGTGVAGFAALATLVTPSSAAIGEFIRVATDMTSRFTWYVPTFAKGQLAAASLFAETAGKVTAIIGTGVAGFAALAGFVAPSNEAIAEFVRVLTDITSRVAWFMPTFAKGQLAAAQLFAETAGKVTAIIGGGVAGFNALADFRAPTNATIDAFAASVGALVARIAGIAASFSADGLAAAGLFGDAAGKVLAVLGNGVSGLTGLFAFVAPPTAALDAFAASVQAMVARFGWLAATLSGDGLTAAQTFATAAGAVFGALTSATGFFKSLDNLLLPDLAGINRILAPITATIDAVLGVAARFGTAGLTAAQQFAVTVGAIFGAMQTATTALGRPGGTGGLGLPATGGGGYGGGGGGLTVNLTFNAPILGVTDFNNAVVAAVVEAERRGRL